MNAEPGLQGPDAGSNAADLNSGLYVSGLTKGFGGTLALDDVTAHFPRGSITALLGQNGSGKSTLIKILAGFYAPDGEPLIKVAGEIIPTPVNPSVVHEAGLRFLHQDLGLVDAHSIADNFAFAGRFRAPLFGRIRQREENRYVERALERFGIDVDPRTKVSELPPTERTMVAIARAFVDETDETAIRHNVMILDEPTASLPASEVERVFAALEQIRDAGGAVIFVSHRIDEVLRIADRLVVLRDGRLVADRAIAGLTASDVVTLIVGRDVERTAVRSLRTSGKVVLEARGLVGSRLKGIDFELRRGEIVGVTGLLGCGRSELARILAGAQLPREGTLLVDGEPVTLGRPGTAIAAGIGFVPQNRRVQGCIPDMTIRENITLASLGDFWANGRLRHDRERAATRSAVQDFGITPADPERRVAHLSGGNQQKAVVAKWTRLNPRILVLDEPTQGVDIGAKREIARITQRLADDGVAVLVGSSDYDELVDLCDRVIVLNRGELVAEVGRDELTEERLTLLATTAEEMTV